MNWLGMLYICFGVFVLLLASELGWRKGWLRNEFGRKFVHISVGTFVAFWPYFIGWAEVIILSLAFFFGVIAAFRLGLFRAVSTYQRPTYGEVLFALSVGFLAVLTNSKGIYAAAILQMALADGFAAIVGKWLGKNNQYKILGRTKSVAGTLTFFLTSATILIGYSQLSDNGLAWQFIVLGAVGATVLENSVSLGLDNLFVPAFIGLMLQSVA